MLRVQFSIFSPSLYVVLMTNFRRVKCNSNNNELTINEINYLLFELHLTRRKFDLRATYNKDLTYMVSHKPIQNPFVGNLDRNTGTRFTGYIVQIVIKFGVNVVVL